MNVCGKVWEIRLADCCCGKLLRAPWSSYNFQPSKLVRVGHLFCLWLRYRSNLQQYNEGFEQRRGNEETHRYWKMQTHEIKRGLWVTFYRKWTDVNTATIKEYFKGLFSGLSCESVTHFLSAGAHRHISIYEICINKDFVSINLLLLLLLGCWLKLLKAVNLSPLTLMSTPRIWLRKRSQKVNMRKKKKVLQLRSFWDLRCVQLSSHTFGVGWWEFQRRPINVLVREES